MPQSRHVAVVGAGIAGITCARTLQQSGQRVTLFEKSAGVGGRMATRASPFGGFDHGAQYFTVRDPRFALALQTVPGLCKPWSANTVRVLDERGQVAVAGFPAPEPHWVPTPGMNALAGAWAKPLQDRLLLETRVTRIERDARQPARWQLHTTGPDVDGNHARKLFHLRVKNRKTAQVRRRGLRHSFRHFGERKRRDRLISERQRTANARRVRDGGERPHSRPGSVRQSFGPGLVQRGLPEFFERVLLSGAGRISLLFESQRGDGGNDGYRHQG